jgi:hypothetical protein
MPHSIVRGDACFAYFNKIWGIPNTSSAIIIAPPTADIRRDGIC